MPTQADQNLLDISFNRNYRTTNNPNYQFVNFFNLNEPTQYTIGAFNDPKGFNFTPNSTIQLGGIHTVDSCKLNATAYDISINNIDYQAINNYVKDKVKIKTLITPISLKNVVNVDSFNKVTSTEYPIINPINTVKSIEYFGYIVSSDSGNYTVNLNTGVNGKIIAWLQSGAETTYRSSNAHRNSFISPEVNSIIYLAKNVFVPFRIQIEFSESTSLSTLPFNITSDSNVSITDFYMLNRDLKKQIVFSYQTDISQCKIYSGNEFEKYGIDKKIWETGKETNNIEVLKAKEWVLASDTDTVGLDFSGNVVSYNINNTIVGSIFSSNFTNLNDSSGVNLFSNVYMYLSTDNAHRIKIMKTNLTTSGTSGTGLNLVSEPSVGTYSVGNPDWNRFTLDTDSNPRNYIYKDRSANGRDQRRDQRITADSPMVTVNQTHNAPRWMLALDKSRNPPYLVLYKNRVSNTTYYGINVDPKAGRTFYANKNSLVDYIREVPRDFLKYAAPSEVSTYSQLTYHTYDEYYPSSGTQNTTTRGCTADCNSKDDCTHVYEVNGGCIFGKGQPTYLPKQSESVFTSSKLHVKQKVLDETKILTDISFSRTYQIDNVTSYNNYTMFLPLTANTRAQTSGEYDYINLQNRVFGSTTTRYNPFQAESSFNIVNPIGMKEGYRSLEKDGSGNINTNIENQLQNLSGEFVSYVNQQQKVMKNATDISAAIVDINRKYTTMANDNSKYDFTTGKINALEDDYTLATALLKDNKIFLEEQSNLKIVGTITLATLLISAIFISR